MCRYQSSAHLPGSHAKIKCTWDMRVSAFESVNTFSNSRVARVACVTGRVVHILLTIGNGEKLPATIITIQSVATECNEVVRG